MNIKKIMKEIAMEISEKESMEIIDEKETFAAKKDGGKTSVEREVKEGKKKFLLQKK